MPHELPNDLRPSILDPRKFGNIRKISKLERIIAQRSFLPLKWKCYQHYEKSFEKQKLNLLSLSALFQNCYLSLSQIFCEWLQASSWVKRNHSHPIQTPWTEIELGKLHFTGVSSFTFVFLWTSRQRSLLHPFV